MIHASCSQLPRATIGSPQIFEQDAHAFTRRLNGILAPGPLCYVAKIDAFVVGNEMGVDCYKYQVSTKIQMQIQRQRSPGPSYIAEFFSGGLTLV